MYCKIRTKNEDGTVGEELVFTRNWSYKPYSSHRCADTPPNSQPHAAIVLGAETGTDGKMDYGGKSRVVFKNVRRSVPQFEKLSSP